IRSRLQAVTFELRRDVLRGHVAAFLPRSSPFERITGEILDVSSNLPGVNLDRLPFFRRHAVSHSQHKRKRQPHPESVHNFLLHREPLTERRNHEASSLTKYVGPASLDRPDFLYHAAEVAPKDGLDIRVTVITAD